MGAQKLEARLTWRLVGLAGAVIVLVGATPVLVTDRLLDASDSDIARGQARTAVDSLDIELAEGDAWELAAGEVVTAAEGGGARLHLVHGADRLGDGSLPMLAPGSCATITRERGEPWRACGAGDAVRSAVAAVPIGAHRAAIAALSRGMVAVIAVALVLLWLAVRRALRQPIAELAAVVSWTAKIVDSQSPDPPPPALTREVAQIESAFDALVRRLFEALARERASSAHIAHELRTPLTAIVAELDAVKGADESSRAALARVRGDVARFADVIEAILVLSEAPRSRRAGRPDAVVNVADLARELAPASAVVDAPDEALVEGDERLVRLAMQNLVDNARKYGGGAQRVRLSREAGAVRVAVIDGGPGVDGAVRERMFERYWRGVADGDGRGLGLAFVRAVAERHDGSARADAGADGRGLEVSLTLGHLLEWREAS